MQTIATTGIVLSRTNYQEADRIMTFLTSNQGKVRVIAKGVRKAKSKMAGGIELFSVSGITYVSGVSELHTLVSARLKKHYGNIVADINKTLLAYEFMKRINKVTEDAAGAEYFELLNKAL